MAMDYFRRPVLAGRNLSRTTNAVCRGSVRRSDPDGTSAVPYFPNLNIGDSLTVEVDGTPQAPVVFTGVDLQTVLDDLNAGISGSTAFDADGCVAFITDTIGSAGSIAVTAGTGAAALGFDLVANTSVKSYGGEIPSTTEGRLGNWFGSAFPNKGENFTTESMARPVARLAANMDVLFSDLSREQAKVQKIGTVTGLSVDVKTLAVTPAVYTGLGFLSRTSSKADLSPFFFVFDTVSGMPAASRVTAVTRGTPGSYPRPGGGYADTASWGAADGGNILGLNLAKVNAQAITEVHEGRVVVVPAANFTTSLTRAGDLAQISGATNLTPFSHNGNQWVVEKVISATAISLRPMSKAELAMVGVSPAAIQPMVELNGEKGGGEVYGNLTIRNGTFANAVTLVFEPPIPPGATYEIWAASPTNYRDAGATHPQQALDAYANLRQSSLATDQELLPSQVLSGLAATPSGVNLAVASGYLRWKGRVIYFPARTWANDGTEIPAGVSYLYFDEVVGQLKIAAATANWASYFDDTSSNRGLLLAKLTSVTSTSVTVESAERLAGEKHKSLTVGRGGQFGTLKEAVSYANLWASAKGESGTTTTGDFSHFDIVLLNDHTISADITISANGLVIRGANPGVTLTFNACKLITSCATLTLKDMALATTGSMVAVPLTAPTATLTLSLLNVRQSSGSFSHLIKTSGAQSGNLICVDSTLLLARGISWADSAGTVFISRSQFSYVSDGAFTTPILFSNVAGTGSWNGIISVFESTFNSWVTTSNSVPIFANIAGANPSRIVGCDFVLGSFAADLDSLFLQASARVDIDATRISAANGVSRAILGSANTIVRNCDITVKPQAASAAGIYCRQAIGNTVSVLLPSTLGNEGIGIKVSELATNNLVTGQAKIGIATDTSANGVNISNNLVNINYGVAATATGIQLSNTNGTVTGNTVRMQTVTPSTSKSIQSIATNQASITGNHCLGTVTYNIHVAAGTDVSISGNSGNGKVFLQPPVSAVFELNSNSFNSVLELADGGVIGTVKAVGNSFHGLTTSGLTDVGLVHLVSNHFTGTVVTTHLTSINGNTFHNATLTYGPGTVLPFCGNLFSGNTTIDSDAPGDPTNIHLRFEGNRFLNTGAVLFQMYTFFFRNNEVSGPASFDIFSDYGDGGQLEIDGNHFDTLTSTFEVTQFTNNVVTGGTLSLTGKYTFNTFNHLGAPAAGNFFYGVTLTAVRCAFGGSGFQSSGCTFNTCSLAGSMMDGQGGALSLTSCSISGSRLHTDGAAITLTSCDVAGSHLLSENANLNLASCELSGSSATASTGSVLFTGNSKTTGCELSGSAALSWSGGTVSHEVSSCLLLTNFTASGAGSNFYMSSCEAQGTTGITATGSVQLTGCQFVGNFTCTGSAALRMSACAIAGTTTMGSTSGGFVGIGQSTFTGDYTWNSANGHLHVSGSSFAGNVTTPNGSSNSAENVTLQDCYINGFVTLYGNKYLTIVGCNISEGQSATDLTLKSGFGTNVSSCIFWWKVVLRGNSLVVSNLSNNIFPALRCEDSSSSLRITGNKISAFSSGANSVIPCSIKAGSLIEIVGNEFTSINGIVAGTTVQSPCIKLGDSNANTIEGIVIDSNLIWMTTRTSNSGATTVGVIEVACVLQEATIVGNTIIRGADANSVTAKALNVTAASSQNFVRSGNNAFINNGGVISYDADPVSKGGLSYTAAAGLLTWP